MGNNASKVGRSSGRVLQQKATQLQTNNTRSANPTSTRPTAVERAEPAKTTSYTNEQTVADRLMKLGQASEKSIQKEYKPPSEDQFTLTLEARQKLEADSTNELEQGGQRKLIPAPTIAAILTSLKEKESVDRIEKSFNLHPSVLPKLKAVSLPFMPQDKVANELLHSGNAERQPVRRKR